MKKTLIVFIVVAAFLRPVFVQAQPKEGTVSGSTDNVRRSMELAEEMVRLVKALPDSFKTYRGELSPVDGMMSFKAKDTVLGTDSMYIMAKVSGAVVFRAFWRKRDEEDKTPTFAYAAFIGGIPSLTEGQGYDIKSLPADGTTGDRKNYLTLKGRRVATFIYNPIFKRAALMVGE